MLLFLKKARGSDDGERRADRLENLRADPGVSSDHCVTALSV